MALRKRSSTAELAAALRVWHTLFDDHPTILDDRAALPLLSPGLRNALQAPAPGTAAMAHWWERAQPETAALRGQAVARARYAEEALDAAIARGCRQIVILGAGLDTTAMRRPDLLHDATLFELDHPATQAWKQKQLAGCSAERIQFVPIDLEIEALGQRMLQSGLDPAQPIFATWLGSIYYLEAAAIRRTFSALAEIAPAHSELVLDYWLPGEDLTPRYRLMLHGLRVVLQAQQEPLRGLLEPQTMRAHARRAGWRVAEELDSRAQAERWLRGRGDTLTLPAFARCAHLIREPDPQPSQPLGASA